MTAFNYTVRNLDGDLVKGSIDAETQDVVVSKLKEMDYFIVNINEVKEKKTLTLTKKGSIGFSFFNRIKIRDMVVFTRQFSTRISSGMSLLESLTVLEKQTSNPKFANIIAEIRMDVESGHSLSESMEKYSNVFSDIYVSLIRAGEAGGVLDKTMDDLAGFLEKEEEIKLKVRNKTAYPKFVLGFAVVITFVIIVFLVPTFKSIYEELGAQLPMITRVTIFIGDLFKNIYFYLILAVLIFGGRYLFKKAISTPRGKYIMDNIKINIPKFGDMFKKLALSRFTRHFGVLLTTGVPILSALEISKGVAGNIIIDNAIDKIRQGIREGENIADPMSKMTIFPAMMVQMMAIGEKTGTLDEIVTKISDFYDREVTNNIDILLTILEPLMLLFVAGIVGVIILSMYLPMFNMYQAM
jgi:type IV pilus assembly protein PilC